MWVSRRSPCINWSLIRARNCLCYNNGSGSLKHHSWVGISLHITLIFETVRKFVLSEYSVTDESLPCRRASFD
ncbi:hypothetical protein Y032_0086g1945 [Ancylostoma ceylanicum]|uniref:Uncharacterized protein n=1 Tax=Ancylostoma ceylanicum TaxID=53326 RepID=A0A016TNX3_9BILA|nr:hypothetical protein Y032_0086g1945 [Ancylostoma ceylanicum]